MRIGIDIDDTITNTSEVMIEYAKKWFQTDDDSLIEKVVHGDYDPKIDDFYLKNLYEMVDKYTVKENVKDVIDRLRKKGHKIIIITARGDYLNGLMEKTDEYLKDNNILVDKIVYGAVEKLSPCISEKIDLMIDDSLRVQETLAKNNIDTLVFTSVSNKNIPTNLKRVNNWLEIEDYINNIDTN